MILVKITAAVLLIMGSVLIYLALWMMERDVEAD